MKRTIFFALVVHPQAKPIPTTKLGSETDYREKSRLESGEQAKLFLPVSSRTTTVCIPIAVGRGTFGN